ncbi:SDR family oxidoreductase [Salmonella enterica]|nr:SDR family oxidoreductase [Salmonella enterica]
MMNYRTFLVTGASRGIGLAISKLLNEQGHQVIGIARQSAKDFPGSLISCDLSDFKQTTDTLQSVSERYVIDGIVNNAGIVSPQSLTHINFSVLQSVFDLNVRAAIQVTQHFISGMRQRGYGRIVNICSRAICGSINRTAYSASKSALVGCTRTWALELAESGITVNAVSPGPVDTELFRKNHPVGSEAEQKVLRTIPMRRPGEPEEIASVVSLFLSEQASYVTGQVLAVDGGGSLGGHS